MEKKTYEILTDNFPRKNPAGKGALLELTEIEAKYSVLSGDLKLKPSGQQGKKPKGDNPAGAGGSGDGEGEGA